eukprot:scaffold26568_cov98-Skeletonema_marinoi.AAC.2
MKLDYVDGLRESYLSATKIQSAFRMRQCWHEVLRKKEEYRIALAQKEAIAATQIQSAVRMWMCRQLVSRMAEERDVSRKCDAAVVIQSFARWVHCQRELATLKEAAALADHESRLSALLLEMNALNLVHVTRVQALLRGKLVRKVYWNASASAVCIQKNWKVKLDAEVVTYSTYVKSILTVQKKFKRYYRLRNAAAKKIQLSYLSRRMKRNLTEVHRSVNLIQRAVRGHRARCFVQRIKTIRHQSAATKIQSIVRSHRCLGELRLAVTNVTKIQRCYRRFKVTFCENAIRDEKRAYIDMLTIWHREAMAIRIQTVARPWLRHLKRSNAGTKVDAVGTAKSPTSLNTNDSSARVIQSKWRSFRCCKELLVMRTAAVVIQTFVRSWLCQRELVNRKARVIEAELLAKEAATVTIQAFARSLICQKQLSKLKGEAYFVEMQRKETSLLAVRKIQSIVRARRLRRNLQSAFMNAAKIQSCYRCYKINTLEKARQDEKKTYDVMLERCHQESMATRIQAVARSWLRKRKIRTADLSASVIQSKWRSYRCECEMLVRRTKLLERRELAIHAASAVVIQSLVRSRQCQRELTMRRARLRVREAAAVTIQSFARSYNARIVQSRIVSTQLLMRSKSAVLIQSIVRMYLFNSRFDVANKAACTIQHAWRRFVSSLQEKILVVSDLLTVSRCSASFHLPMPMHKARTLLPRDLKRLNRIRSITPHLPRRYECGVFIQEVMNSVAMVIQSFARRYLVLLQVKKLHQAASSVQRVWRLISRQKRLRNAVLKIQSVFRERLVRRNVAISSTIILQRCSRIENELTFDDEEAEQNATIVLQKLLDEDDDLKRLTQYFASLRFTNKQLEEAAEKQWCEEKSRLTEEVRLENIATNNQKERERSETSSCTLRMSTDVEVDSIMKTIYQRAEANAIANETNLTTAVQCVKATTTTLEHALKNETKSTI